MKLTKKQLTVLQKIVGREQMRYNQDAFEQNRSTNKMQRAKIAGVHPCGERFGITDGVLAVLFDEKPDEFVDAERMDILDKYARGFIEDGDLYLVKEPMSIEACKRAIAEWKDMKGIGKPTFPQIMLSTTNENGEYLVSYFNALLYLDALTAAGPYRNLYMGNSRTIKTPHPCLFVFKLDRKNGENNWGEPIFLMPCRPN